MVIFPSDIGRQIWLWKVRDCYYKYCEALQQKHILHGVFCLPDVEFIVSQKDTDCIQTLKVLPDSPHRYNHIC